MLKVFNSIQITLCFAAWPALVAWLSDATFTGATPTFLGSIAAYIMGFIAMTACVFRCIDED